MGSILAVDWVAISAVATAAAALGTLAVVVIAMFQRRDARLAAEAALRAATAAERTVELNLAAQAEQSRLTTYPPLTVRLTGDQDAVDVVLHNPGDLPALDVHVAVLMHLYADDLGGITPAEYTERWGTDDFRRLTSAIEPDDEGEWSIRDFGWWGTVPPRKAVRIPVLFPELSTFISVLVEFRDMLGRNYLQLLLTSWNEEQGRYVGNPWFEDDRIQESPRLLSGGIRNGPSQAPEYVEANFLAAHRKALPVAFYENASDADVDHRGTWSDVA